jgi:hypothetical protein
MAEEQKDPIKSIWTGCVWFVLGGVVIIVVHLLRTSSNDPLVRYGPLVPMFAGAYALVVGVEKMVTGFRAGRAGSDPVTSARAKRALTICGALAVVTLGAGGYTYWMRMPYWDAVKLDVEAQEAINRGEVATQELRKIGQRHATDLQAASEGSPALEIWKRTSGEGRLLKPEFVAAAAGARRLADTQTGTVQSRAEVDVKFYDLCIEWVDLYENIHNQIATTSIEEPPIEWAIEYDDVIDRIQSLIEPHDDQEGHDHAQEDAPQTPPPSAP